MSISGANTLTVKALINHDDRETADGNSPVSTIGGCSENNLGYLSCKYWSALSSILSSDVCNWDYH